MENNQTTLDDLFNKPPKGSLINQFDNEWDLILIQCEDRINRENQKKETVNGNSAQDQEA
jgi:hypothetical protein